MLGLLGLASSLFTTIIGIVYARGHANFEASCLSVAINAVECSVLAKCWYHHPTLRLKWSECGCRLSTSMCHARQALRSLAVFCLMVSLMMRLGRYSSNQVG